MSRGFTTLMLAAALSFNAYAEGNDFQASVDKALSLGSPEAIGKQLDKEVYRGNLVAALELGLMYRDGRIVPQNAVRARRYLATAAEGNLARIWYRYGMADAQFALGAMLQSGVGGKADPAAAESWYTEAANQGHARAQLALARMYFNGTGVKRDLASAYLWSSLPSGLSETEMKELALMRDQAQAQLEPKQMAKAKTLITGWKAKAS